MSRGFPSMTALLGILAVAGYQNRDQIAEMLGGLGKAQPGAPGRPATPGGLGDLLSGLGGSGGGAGVGGLLGGGLNELINRFRENGQAEAAESWVGTGPNKQLAPNQLETAIGADVLATWSQQTGLTREEILARLSKELPSAVDKYTPEGRLPA